MIASGLAASILTATLSFAPVTGSLDETPAGPASETYSEVVVDQVIPQFMGGKWAAVCRDGYWLDRRQGTHMLQVGQGLVVERQDLAISAGELRDRRVKDGPYVRGMVGDVANVWFGDKWVKMTMHCTNNTQYAWLG